MISIRLTLAIVAAFALCGCSWITTFAVVNTSHTPITISYTIGLEGTKVPACPDGNFVDFPRVVAAKEIDALKGLQGEAPRAEFACDKANRTVTLSLAPGHAVSLFRVGTYTGTASERDYLLELSRLTIKGESGELQYTGKQLLRDFEKNSVALWVLTYK